MPTNNLPNPKKTKKKFYNKFVYKVSLEIPGISGLRYFDLHRFLEICQLGQPVPDKSDWKNRVVDKMIANKAVWLSLIPFINQFDSKTYMKRLEGDFIDFYTNDKNFYNGLCKNFSNQVRMRFEPPKGREQQLLEADKIIFANQLPHNTYQYKAYLHPHKILREDKNQLAAWLDNQRPNITFTESIRNWLINTSENWDRRYIYIKDDQTLLMMKLRSPQLIGQIFKYEIIR